jgi:molecular chaperone GrpE
MTRASGNPDDGVVDTASERTVDSLGADLPDDDAEAVEILTRLVLEARDEAAGAIDDLKRVAADFDNFRKRAQRDRSEIVASAAQRVAEALLPVLDSLDSAARTVPETPAEERLLAGLLSTRDQILEVLAGEGLRPLDAEGERFDPSVHEAVRGGGDGHLVVSSQLRRGYAMGDRLLRPVMVEVVAEDISAEETEE